MMLKVIEEKLNASVHNSIKDDVFINLRLITWDDETNTYLHGAEISLDKKIPTTCI